MSQTKQEIKITRGEFLSDVLWIEGGHSAKEVLAALNEQGYKIMGDTPTNLNKYNSSLKTPMWVATEAS